MGREGDRTRAAILVSICGEGRGQDEGSDVGECFGGGEGDMTRAAMLVSVLGEGRGQDKGSEVGECLWGGKGTGQGQPCW